MIKQSEKFLSDILVKNGLLTAVEVNKFLLESQQSGESLNSYLLRRMNLSEDQLLKIIAAQLNLEVVALTNIQIEKDVIDKVPIKFAAYYRFIPIRIENKILTLAVSGPLDVKVLDEIRLYLGLEPRIVMAKEKDILEAIKKHYGLAADTIDKILAKEGKKDDFEAASAPWIEDLENKSEDPTVTHLVNQIILEAYQKRATDIHIEPYRDKVRIRYRIDGVLMDAMIPAQIKHFLLPVLSRIKIMANLSIVEKRLPQDGSAVVKTKDQDLDLRVSTIPTPRGESMVIRILPTKVMHFSLEKLGLDPDHVKIFQELVRKPYGIIFVTGPTGSGKTTTLYSCLKELNSTQRKIITIEDPIEYEMEGVTQIQVNPRVNLDFSTGLRSILRHDPDIIMVGEVRDLETAEIAIRTAMTGHLVFSTLHTNDAASGITRLIEMGLESFLVASSVEAFVAQRLVRVICAHCKEENKEPLTEFRQEISAALGIEHIGQIKIYKGRGCDHCNHTGFYGRSAIYEILVMNDDIRRAVFEKKRSEDIKRIAIGQGMLTLRQDGLRKVLAGITTPLEVLNVTAKQEPLSHAIPGGENGAGFSAPISGGSLATPEVLGAHNDYEARIYPRVHETIEIRYSLLSVDPKELNRFKQEEMEHSAVTRDISAGGLRFISNKSLAVNNILALQIHLEKDERSISCLAKICRVEEDQTNHHFNIMLYYLDISSADRAKLNNFVKQRMK